MSQEIPSPASPSPPKRDERFYAAALLSLILVASFLLQLNRLGHAAIKGLDESFHALVAKNLIHHPLTPTLYDHPWLDYDYRDWQSNHIWLHKPIVPLWQMALSMAIFGVNTLAMRLPSALLSTAAVWLTYAIGVELLDRRAALIAAALQAFNPAIVSLVHGYVFSDHVDIAFLFWVELSAWLLIRAIMREGSARWIIAAGAAQGIAYLCKTYPAFVVTLIATAAWMSPLAGVANPNRRRFGLKHLAIFLAATVITIAPWTIWCATHFPQEFYYEQLQVFRHLSTDVEGWAAPWDRVIFDFSLRIYHVFYPAVLAAALVLIPRAWRERNLKLALLYVWGLGVLIPLTLATSKTPTATLIGWPPFLLLLAAMVTRALDGDAWCTGAWLGVTLAGVLAPGLIPQKGWGYPNPPRLAQIMRENIWVVWHVAIALLAAAGVAYVAFQRREMARRIPKAIPIIAAIASGWLFAIMSYTAYRVSAHDIERPAFVQLGTAANQSLPNDAVLLFEIREKCEHTMMMFSVDRTVYPVTPETWSATANRVRAVGGHPLLVTQRALPLPPVFSQRLDGLNLYDVAAPR